MLILILLPEFLIKSLSLFIKILLFLFEFILVKEQSLLLILVTSEIFEKLINKLELLSKSLFEFFLLEFNIIGFDPLCELLLLILLHEELLFDRLISSFMEKSSFCIVF